MLDETYFLINKKMVLKDGSLLCQALWNYIVLKNYLNTVLENYFNIVLKNYLNIVLKNYLNIYWCSMARKWPAAGTPFRSLAHGNAKACSFRGRTWGAKKCANFRHVQQRPLHGTNKHVLFNIVPRILLWKRLEIMIGRREQVNKLKMVWSRNDTLSLIEHIKSMKVLKLLDGKALAKHWWLHSNKHFVAFVVVNNHSIAAKTAESEQSTHKTTKKQKK